MLGFRVWDTEKDTFVNDENSSNIMLSSGELGNVFSIEGLVHCDTTPSFKKRFIPLQSTGIFDWQGKEIFEGDVLFIYIDSPVGNHYYLVESTQTFLLMLGLIGQRIHKISNDGNRYENPSLLKRLEK